MAERRARGLEPLRPGSSGAVDRQRQMAALAWVGGLVLLVGVLWTVAVASSSDGSDVGDAALLTEDERTAPDPSGSDADPDAGTETEGPALGETEDGSDPLDPDGDISGGDADADADNDADADADDAGDEELTPITFDGVCTVEVPEADRDAQRPWQHEACTYAPVDLEDGERFIVVRASLPPAQADAAAAEQRAADTDPDARVLWSSHYPSLNRGFWVVFEGPFTDIDAARDAAAASGSGAYVRSLNDAD